MTEAQPPRLPAADPSAWLTPYPTAADLENRLNNTRAETTVQPGGGG